MSPHPGYTQASSFSEDSPIRPFGIFSVKFRVGAPPPHTLPLYADYANPQINGIDNNDLTHEALRILSDHGIVDPKIDMVTRKIPGSSTTGDITLFVVAKWEDSATVWERTVRKIKTHVDEQLFKVGKSDVVVYVEMVAPELIMRKYLSPVLDNQHLEEAWPAIKAQVLYRLESFSSTKSFMTAISLFYLGYSADHSRNPITVYISLSYLSNENGWPPVISAIQYDLDSHGWSSLRVHVEHNDMQSYPFQLVPPSKALIKDFARRKSLGIQGDYPQRVDLGSDFSSARYIVRDDGKQCNALLGTLGCYLEINTSTKPDWFKVALTNYHILRAGCDGFSLKYNDTGSVIADPVPNTPLFKADIEGLFPNQQGSAVDIESPSRLKHNLAIWSLDENISAMQGQGNPSLSAKIANFQQQKNRKMTFFDRGTHIMGKPYFASGFKYCTAANQRLDWALVSVDVARQGQNLLPSDADWTAKYGAIPDFPLASTFGALLLPQSGVSLKTMTAGTKVFKVGAATQMSIGSYSRYKTDCKISEDGYMNIGISSEFVVIGRGNIEFANHGDSGAVVFDEEGRAVGLLFSGQTPQQAEGGYALVTPIEDVFDHIKKLSKQRITHIRIAQL
ncbi:hypothetical protein AK830_g8194 [Neonectria ditissima]|uniref:Peptidase S7 domain-containing protein n=1 Tax=Neonectria ditissima TaxID=78410 RepID=A0A0P7BDA0_9HYPO|nr:hypothetical protein AK830_g8194 [Neonectria ditissima]